MSHLEEIARQLHTLARKIEEEALKVTDATSAIAPEQTQAANDLRSAIIRNAALCTRYCGLVISDASNADYHILDLRQNLDLLRDCLHYAAADLTRHTYAKVTDLDRAYLELTKGE